MIIKTNRELTAYQEEIIKYAVSAYGFLVPDNKRNHLSFLEFASIIKEHYSMDNPQNAEICRVLVEI